MGEFLFFLYTDIERTQGTKKNSKHSDLKINQTNASKLDLFRDRSVQYVLWVCVLCVSCWREGKVCAMGGVEYCMVRILLYAL